MIDSSLSGFLVYIKVLEVVVEVDASGAEVSSEQGGVGGEDGRDVDVSLSAERNGETGLPLVEMSDDGRLGVVDGELKRSEQVQSARSQSSRPTNSDEGSGRAPLRGTKRRGCDKVAGSVETPFRELGKVGRTIQKRSSRWSRGRWPDWGFRRGSRDRPSTRPFFSQKASRGTSQFLVLSGCAVMAPKGERGETYRWYIEPVSNRMTLGAPSISQFP